MDTEMVGTNPGSEEEGEGVGTDLIGHILSERYQIVSRIGEGGMGTVYRAEHIHMQKTLAIKVLHPELTSVGEVVQRFIREARAAANIEHQNVCAATDFGQADTGEFYLVMEYLEGEALADVLEQGALPLHRALSIARQMCAALARAHEMGIVHRDLKPENVLLVNRDGEEDFVKVLDFGIARVPIANDSPESQTLTKAGFVMGTPAYLSPEQASGDVVDHRADLYSLGIVLFEMIAGRRPFESPSTVELIGMHVTKPAPPLSRKVPSGVRIPRRLDLLLERLLAKDSRKRPANATEVREELEAIAGRIETRMSSDHVAQIAKDAASRAAEGFNTMRSRVSPVLREVRDAAPDAVPLLKRLPPWIWAVIVANFVIGVLFVTLFWGYLTSDEGSHVETAGVGAGVAQQGDAGAAAAQEAGSSPTLLEKARARPEVAAALAKRETYGTEGVIQELAALYRQQNEPELAYLLAQAEATAGQDRAALLHVGAALSGNEELATDPGMRSFVLKQLGGDHGTHAATLFERHYMPESAGALEKVACSDEDEPGRSRQLAQTLIVRNKAYEAISPYCNLIVEFERTRSCRGRREAVEKMGQLGDPRVLPLLREVDEKVSGRGRGRRSRRYRRRYRCLSKTLSKTLSALEKAPASATAAP